MQPALSSGQPELSSIMVMDPRWVPDDTFVRRLVRAYRMGVEAAKPPEGTIWGNIDKRRAEVHDALISGDIGHVKEVLSHIEMTHLYSGTDQICRDFFFALRDMPEFAEKTAVSIFDHLLNAARTLGVVPLPYPEAVGRQEPEYSVDDLVSRIDALGPFTFPTPLVGEFGLQSYKGIISWKVPMALYQALRLRDLSNIVKGARVLEIGPGTGRGALHAHQLGFKGYTTVDLPMGIIAQACFLGASLGPDALWLPGDKAAPRPDQIRLLMAGQLADEAFDIVVNVDSITEMPIEHARAYFRYAMKNAKVFMSINHEINPFRVRDLAEGSDCSTLRSVCTIRPGYTEECFFRAD